MLKAAAKVDIYFSYANRFEKYFWKKI